MIDFSHIESYKENNRIEAKRALGGFPKSLWETYSAFANTLGGIILLGVEEHRDKSFHAIDLPNPERLINEFWSIVNNPNKVSVNILSKKDVTVEMYDGKHIVAIRVPRAKRSEKPVYIDGNPMTGAYRRNGEGDYRCTEAEIQSMLRDAELKTQDMRVIKEMGIDSLDKGSVRRYRSRLRGRAIRGKLGEAEFLHKIGAIEISNGEYRPTSAGLLMFGKESEIVKEYPDFLLEYRGEEDTDVIASNSGKRSGNVFDFYFAVCDRLTKTVRDRDIKNAMCEALTNCIINADYYGKNGVKVENKDGRIIFSNPGGFRVDVESAKTGGISDPRNGALTKMFKLLDIGEGSGSGIPNIFKVWKEQGLPSPIISEEFEPDRINFILPMNDSSYKKGAKSTEEASAVRSVKTALIIEYLTKKISATDVEISIYTELKLSRTREYLNEMLKKQIIETVGLGRRKKYKLKD